MRAMIQSCEALAVVAERYIIEVVQNVVPSAKYIKELSVYNKTMEFHALTESIRVQELRKVLWKHKSLEEYQSYEERRLQKLGRGDDEEAMKKIAAYILSLSKGYRYTAEGKISYEQMCLYCHGKDGIGNTSLGAANISDSIWLHVEDSNPGIVSQIENPQHGVMPAWEGRLDDATIRQLAVYVHSLGGGE